VNNFFHKFSTRVAKIVGSPWAFAGAVLVILLWIFTGPIFGYSDTWQLVINTGTTVITFLIVFIIQNTQNRESAAMQLKLDELIRAITNARNKMVNLEELTEEELASLQEEFRKLQEKAKLKDQTLARKNSKGAEAEKTIQPDRQSKAK
jgi:low affinity Fe/Cu permease